LIWFLELNPFESMGKNLVVEIKISFALNENGTGARVKVIDGVDQSHAQGLLKPKEGGGRDRDAYFFQ
jgi:hypothetical protein